ncbi:hypothetical protein BGZ60DRAFT_525449 [Tricladium varicosporioides]|nr:hypothetical protein BGZ60DRAFT_525449 [Hymenoscyphus varicosporioides]
MARHKTPSIVDARKRPATSARCSESAKKQKTSSLTEIRRSAVSLTRKNGTGHQDATDESSGDPSHEYQNDEDASTVDGLLQTQSSTVLGTKKRRPLEDGSGSDSRREISRRVIPSSSPIYEPSTADFPDVAFDLSWTLDDELELQGTWKGRNQFLLERMAGSEPALWRYASDRFSLPPPALLPRGYRVSTMNNSTLTYNRETFVSPLWSARFCTAFSKLICCPAFAGRPEFVRHALEWAHFHRVGRRESIDVDGENENDDRPSDNVPSDRLDGFIQAFYSNADANALDLPSPNIFRGLFERTLRQTLTDVFGTDQPAHIAFLDCLERVVKKRPAPRGKHSRKTSGITIADVEAICEAWDTYTDLPSNKALDLKNSQFSFENTPHPRGPQRNRGGGHKVMAWNMKKKLILDERREKWRQAHANDPAGETGIRAQQEISEGPSFWAQEAFFSSPVLGRSGSIVSRAGSESVDNPMGGNCRMRSVASEVEGRQSWRREVLETPKLRHQQMLG